MFALRRIIATTLAIVLAVVAVSSFGATASADATNTGVYVVRSGDSIYGIANAQGVSVTDLMSANDLEITSVILPGQRLAIPGAAPATPSSPSSGGSTYTVVAGDSLSGIASKHGVRLVDLLAVNGLRIDSVIHPGRLLKLPAGATVTAPAATPAPATPAATPAPASPASSLTHTVVAGNSLSGIAARYSVKLADLLAVNGMQVDSLILPGQVVKLPADADSSNAATPAPASTTPVSGATQSRIDTVVAYALAQVGKDYSFFTKGPDSFDCSGLTLMAYRQVGIDLVHWSAAQANQGTRVDLDHDGIRAGDLVFQQRNGSLVINHVGIAIDGNRWVHAVGPGKGVRIGTLPDASTISVVRRYTTD